MRDTESAILAEHGSLAEKMHRVTPALLAVYAEDGVMLEQPMAFTVNSGHARQVQVWDVINSSWNKEPFQLWHMLTDLFQGDDGGWIEDTALLDRLMTRKLQAETQTSAVESWKWIMVALDLPYSYSHDLRSLPGEPEPMTDNEGATHAMLGVDYRALEEENAGQGELPDEIDTPGAMVKKFETRSLTFDQSEVGRAGVFDTFDRYGALAVYRRYLRPENELREETAVQNGATMLELSSCRVVTPIGADLPKDQDDGAAGHEVDGSLDAGVA
ncbi:hypothetical protein [Thalassobius taeanensis]|uniref:Chromosome partitioning protein, ParB family n=1 Tax=Thalassovita taeanensis TaxID=657014 RepID=A0A1H9K2P9_9RHOB|nr:chromosome partitioning protein, ParB family [Thalassovita taeanensis]